jgi:hypothetical protein
MVHRERASYCFGFHRQDFGIGKEWHYVLV